MFRRLTLRLLLAFALAFSGSAVQLHALAHAQADLSAAAEGSGQKAPAAPKHSTDQCLVVHALDGAAAGPGPLLLTEDASHRVVPHAEVRSGESPAVAFHSRAPPASA